MNIVKQCTPALVVLLMIGCGKNDQEQSAQMQKSPSITQGSKTSATSAGGVRWNLPERWKQEGDRPMRVATYAVPAAEGDEEDGECAAYYFGKDQGGDVKANIQRWTAQFENPSGPEQSTSEINGMNVTSVQITGTYLAPKGPMMQSEGKKEHYKLLGAIIEAPEGSVFFKFTGPEKTVDAAKEEFNSLIQSITKQ